MPAEPTCEKCGGLMTPDNSRIHPELFLHDRCLPEELRPAEQFQYSMLLTVNIRALPSCAVMLDTVNDFMRGCGFHETVVAFVPLTAIIITVNRELLSQELVAVYARAEQLAAQLSEATGFEYRVEEPELIQ